MTSNTPKQGRSSRTDGFRHKSLESKCFIEKQKLLELSKGKHATITDKFVLGSFLRNYLMEASLLRLLCKKCKLQLTHEAIPIL